LILPARKLHCSKALSLDQLALVETLGIGAHAVNRAQLEPGEWVLVLGAGPIGLSVIQFALAAGARVIVRDVVPSRLAFCQKNLGVEHAIDFATDPLDQVRELTDQELPTAVFDATGNAESMARSFDYVAHGGRVVFVGLIQGDVPLHDPHIHRREISLLASRNCTSDEFRQILTLVESGRIETRHWITHRASFSSMINWFPTWVDPLSGTIKAIVELD
jgi:2-desacetyl-2-hydroxyethyl bacteriochlorophyllide A dehydrogenase